MSDKLVGRKIRHLKLHQGVFIPGYGNLGDVLPPQNKSFTKFEMTYTKEGVVVEINSIDTVMLYSAQCAVTVFERLPKNTPFAVVPNTKPKDSEVSA